MAFISVFNVQMLYLPGLKNVFADFLSCPPGPLPPEPSGTVAAEAAADPIDFKAMAAEQICCAKTQRLLSSSSLKIALDKQVLNAWLATFQLESSAPLSQPNS